MQEVRLVDLGGISAPIGFYGRRKRTDPLEMYRQKQLLFVLQFLGGGIDPIGFLTGSKTFRDRGFEACDDLTEHFTLIGRGDFDSAQIGDPPLRRLLEQLTRATRQMEPSAGPMTARRIDPLGHSRQRRE